MSVRRLKPQQAKEQLEYKENELERAARWLNEQHAQVREMEAQLLCSRSGCCAIRLSQLC